MQISELCDCHQLLTQQIEPLMRQLMHVEGLIRSITPHHQACLVSGQGRHYMLIVGEEITIQELQPFDHKIAA